LVREGASALAGRLRSRFGGRIIGPEEPVVARINDLYQRNILLKFEREASPQAVKAALKEDVAAFKAVKPFKPIRVIIDVDPY
jgi:primosomal protein N' (replication factor Y)